MRALVVAAHPDDEVLGCGGTMARLCSEGWDVHVHILGQGAMSRQSASTADVEALQNATAEAMKTLGVQDFVHHNLPDNRLDTIPLLDVTQLVEGIVTDLWPEAIYTHHVGDLNVDHRLTALSVLTATRPMSNRQIPDVYLWETPSSTEWSFGKAGFGFEPNVFVEITEQIEVKLEALSAYGSELREFPHPRSNELVRALALVRGASAGVVGAEAFDLVRSVRPQKKNRD